MAFKLDEIDVKLLSQLQNNARVSVKEISRKIHLSPNAVSARIKRLEDTDYIKGYVAILNKDKIERKLESFTGISLHQNNNFNLVSFLDSVKDIPEICSCYLVNGMFDFVLRIAVNDMEEYRKCMVNTLSKIESISEIRTFFVLDEIGSDYIVDLTHLMRKFRLKLDAVN